MAGSSGRRAASLSEQSDTRFDIVVADDGSGLETAAVVDRWRAVLGDRVAHVWHPHRGFRRRSRATAAHSPPAATTSCSWTGTRCRGVISCERCKTSIRPGWFVAGRKLELSETLTERVLAANDPIHHHGFYSWFRARRDASPVSSLSFRDRRRVGTHGVPEFEPHNRAYGFLLGVARRDFQQVERFDTRYEGWGDEDVDFALRLRRLGLRCGHSGPDAVVLHLWHPPREKRNRQNWWLLRETEGGEHLEAVRGFRELELAPTADQVSAAY